MPDDISQLIAGLTSTVTQERAEAAEQLARLGTEARGAAVPLVRASGDEEEEVSEWAVSALEDLGPPSAEDLHALSDLLDNDRTPDVRYWAATLLGRLGKDASPAVPVLSAALDPSNDRAVRQRAAWALGKIGSAAVGASARLEEAAQSTDPRLARLARRALDAISP